MVHRSRQAAALAAAAAAIGILSASAWGADTPPLPVQAPDVQAPDVPGSPSVGVTPSDSGAGIDVGAADTAVHVGAGTNGVSYSLGARSSPKPGSGGNDSAPVTGPVRKPVRRPAPSSERGSSSGASPTVFGAAGNGAGSRSVGGTRRPSGRAGSPSGGATAGDRTKPPGKANKSDSKLPPVFELVDRIPATVRGALIALAIIALALWGAWIRDRRRLAANAFVDPVTGIANSTAFTRVLDQELTRARRYKRPLGLLMVDLSDAERDNGRLRLMGATRIREATAMISAKTREADTVASLEGDRFAVICPEASAGSSETLARALESSLEMLRLHARVGVAERRATDHGAADMILRATAALRDAEASPDQAEKPPLLRVA